MRDRTLKRRLCKHIKRWAMSTSRFEVNKCVVEGGWEATGNECKYF